MTSGLNMELIQQVIDERLNKDRKKWGPYNSPHEGLAVIMEEQDEAHAEAANLKDAFNDLRNCVYYNYPKSIHLEEAQYVYDCGIALAVEALHVAISAKKYMENCDASVNQFGLLK